MRRVEYTRGLHRAKLWYDDAGRAHLKLDGFEVQGLRGIEYTHLFQDDATLRIEVVVHDCDIDTGPPTSEVFTSEAGRDGV